MNDLLHTIKNFYWIYKPLTNKSKVALLVAFVMILIASLVTSVIPSLTGTIIDDVISKSPFVNKTIIIIGLLFILRLVVEVIRKYIIERISTQTQKQFIVKVSQHILTLDLCWLNLQRSGGLNGKIQRSVEGAIKLLKLSTMDFLPNMLQMLFAIVVAFFTNIYIGAILLCVVIIGILIVVRQIKSQKGIRISLLRARDENDSNIVELLTGIEAVRVANEEKKQIKRIDSVNEDLRVKEMTHHVKMMIFDSIKSINIMFWNLIILLIGIYLATSGIITPGDIVVFNLLLNNVVTPLQNIHRFVDEAHEASLRTDDLVDILSESIDHTFIMTSQNDLFENIHQDAIKIENLSYSYYKNLILKNVSYSFKKGHYYGIVGNTGCGKSTLLKLMMRLMPVNNNELYIFNTDINNISKEKLSSVITFMPQTPFIFNETIKENLLFGCKADVSDEDLWWALEQVCLSDYVRRLDKGLDYILNERASNISGGQKQRIALARVFLNSKYGEDVQIIILDEATSALDVETENIVINNLLKLKSSNTTIIAIAHRHSTLEKTNEILEIHEGVIRRTISYEELISEKPDKNCYA